MFCTAAELLMTFLILFWSLVDYLLIKGLKKLAAALLSSTNL